MINISYRSTLVRGWIAFISLALLSTSFSQITGSDPLLKPAELEARIKALAEAPEGDNEARTALASYRDALGFFNDAEKARVKTKEFKKNTAAAPAQLEKLSVEPPVAAPIAVPRDASLEKVENLSDVASATLAEAKAEMKARTKEAKAMVSRQSALPGLIAEAKSNLAALPKIDVPIASSSQEQKAAYQRDLAQRTLLKNEIAMFTAEMSYLEQAPALFSAETGLLSRRISTLSENAEKLRQWVEQMKLDVAGSEIVRTRAQAESFPEGSKEREIATEIMNLAIRHGGKGGLSEKIAASTANISVIQEDTDRISKQFSGAKERVKLLEEVGLPIDAATGRLLRTQRQKLPSETEFRANLRAAVEESAQIQIERLTLEDRYAELLAKPAPDPAINSQLAELWKARLAGLRMLLQDHRDYIKNLRTITTEIRNLIDTSSEFALYVNERLLWIPSLGRIKGDELSIEITAYSRFLQSKPFLPLYRDLKKNYILWALVGIVFTYLVIRRRTFRARLRTHGAAASKRICTSFVPTLLALFYSILLAAPIPLLAWFIYGRAHSCPESVIEALRSVAGFLTVIIFFRVLAQTGGVLVQHLELEESRVVVIRKALDWFIPVMPLFLFFAIVLPNESGAVSGGRLTFIAVVLILMILFEQVLRPSKNVVHWQGKPANHFAKACYLLALLVSLALIVGAAIGYYASVQEVRIQVLMSVGQILITLLTAGILHRWILVSRRRLAVQQAMKRRAATLADKENKEIASEGKPQNIASVEEVKANALKVVEVEEQTNRLVRAAAFTVIAFGLFGIWRSAIPALSALDRVTLWEQREPSGEHTETVLPNPISALTTTTSSEGSRAEEHIEDELQASDNEGPITLQDLFVAIVILLLTFVAARNIPGLLELAVFRHMHLAPGASFAFTTTIRYMIVVIGIIMAFGQIGIDWGKVQWIAAAVTLGIGFGLQEIFANFVAGLIILFERPIRLGDIVTIAGVDGKITQIRIRATTVRQFNNRELIVPNKEFITGQLVNWTLSDNILRFDLPVGVAYGSDTDLAHKILLEAARKNPRVLSDPAPVAVFDNFADSSLAFILRGYIAGIDDLLPAKS